MSIITNLYQVNVGRTVLFTQSPNKDGKIVCKFRIRSKTGKSIIIHNQKIKYDHTIQQKNGR